MKRVLTLVLAALLVVPSLAPGAPTSAPDRRLNLEEISAFPSFVRRVEPAIVGLRVRNAENAASSARLGSRRFGSAVIFDGRGYALTVSYLLLDSIELEARGRDGRAVPAQVVGVDLDTGLGVVKLEGDGPWPVATLGDSRAVVAGARTGTVGVDEDNDLIQVTGAVNAVKRFSAYWEYMLDRAIIVAPASPQWGGSAVVNDRGELIESGRIASRPPRPWLGLYTVALPAGLFVSELSPVGPASRAGFRQGDRILKINGVAVASQEEFYEQLWSRRAGDLIELSVQRDNQVRTISVPSVDRHGLFQVR